MSDEDVVKLKKQIMNQAIRLGFRDDAEDIAHDVLCNMLAEGPKRKSIKYLVIDVLRLRCGRKGHKDYEGRLLLANATSFEADLHEKYIGIECESQWCDKLDLEKMIESLSLEEHREFLHYFLLGFDQKDAGKKIGIQSERWSSVTMDRIIQILSLRFKV
jgi:DNA-directed RNA polymerase specialized sigma24 family protein